MRRSAVFTLSLVVVIALTFPLRAVFGFQSENQPRLHVTSGFWFAPLGINDVLPGVQTALNVTEDSDCFRNFFIDRQDNLIEKEVHSIVNGHDTTTPRTIDQILDDLTHKRMDVQLTWHWIGSACGSEGSSEGGDIPTLNYCWGNKDEGERAAYIGHEISHKLGYQHNTAGQQEAGNEFTIPYSINAAFKKCYVSPSAH